MPTKNITTILRSDMQQIKFITSYTYLFIFNFIIHSSLDWYELPWKILLLAISSGRLH